MENNYVVIMAGGTGTRLWPLSREKRPKQFLQLVGDLSLLQTVYRQVKTVVPADQIFIVADQEKGELAQKQLPQHRKENFIIEPEARDNGPAIALAALLIHERDPKAIMSVLWSDHSIQNEDKFTQVIKSAFTISKEYPDHLITVGVNPTYPATSFGYIRLGHEVKANTSDPVFKVDQFIEKPDIKTATSYLQDWRFLWNTGYKIFPAQLMLDLFKKHQPKDYQHLMAIKKDPSSLQSQFKQMEKRDIERLITEKTDKILVIPADLRWSDIGNWKTLHDVLLEKNGQNYTVHGEGDHISVNSRRCLVMGQKKLIATVGLEDIVIVETDDAILVAHKSAAPDVKEIIQQLKEQGKNHYL